VALLEHIRKLPHGRGAVEAIGERAISRQGATKASLESELQALVERGDLVETRSGHYTAVGSSREFATGRLNAHRDGYAFVTPDIPITGLRGDIYLAKEEAERAMHGDRVVVRIARIENDGRAHGEILRVLRRAHATVVGEFRIKKAGFFVIPHDDRIRLWIEIPKGMALPRKWHVSGSSWGESPGSFHPCRI